MLTPRQARDFKLESLVTMAGGIAHDFNNFVAAIIGNNNIVLRHLPSGSPALRNAGFIESTALQAMELTNNLLYFSARGELDAVEIHLEALVTDMAASLNLALNRGVNLEFKVPPDCPVLLADEKQIRIVLHNLVVNASDALRDMPGGTVTVSAGPATVTEDTLRDAYSNNKCNPGPCIFIEVDDKGCGMTEEEQARMFDPFFSTKLRGRGMGLPVVQGIVRAHGGAIFVKSGKGAGTTIRMVFPCEA